jgi:stage II sporulation protein R
MKENRLFGTGKRPLCAWLLLAACIAVFLLVLLMPLYALGCSEEEAVLLEAYQRGEVIRLHIVAKDDSPLAQAQKLAIRDAVLEAFGRELAAAGTADADAAYALLAARREQILSAAQSAAEKIGCTDSLRAEVGLLELPRKQYGNVVLPPGQYRGLRLVIGEGLGENWWCILFPRLCLSLAGEAAEPAQWEWKSLRILSLWPAFAP